MELRDREAWGPCTPPGPCGGSSEMRAKVNGKDFGMRVAGWFQEPPPPKLLGRPVAAPSSRAPERIGLSTGSRPGFAPHAPYPMLGTTWVEDRVQKPRPRLLGGGRHNRAPAQPELGEGPDHPGAPPTSGRGQTPLLLFLRGTHTGAWEEEGRGKEKGGPR